MMLILCRCYLSEGVRRWLLADHVSRSYIFSWSDKLTFPASRFRLEAVTLLCSHTFSSTPPDRLHWVWLTLPLQHHIVLKFIKIKFERFFNAQNTVFKDQSEITWKYASLCRKLYIIIAYYCQSVPATVCYSVPVYFWVRRQVFFIETLILKHPGPLNLCRLQVQQNFDHILLLGLSPSALHFEQSSLSKCLQFLWIYP